MTAGPVLVGHRCDMAMDRLGQGSSTRAVTVVPLHGEQLVTSCLPGSGTGPPAGPLGLMCKYTPFIPFIEWNKWGVWILG